MRRPNDQLVLARFLSVGYALMLAAIFHAFRHEVGLTQERAEALIRLATDQEFPQWKAIGAFLRGWTLAHQEQAQEGIKQLTQGLNALHAIGVEINRSYFLALLAEAHSTMRQPDTGLTILTEALTLIDTTGERWYEPELYRFKGELLLQRSPDNHVEAEFCFAQAMMIAQNQQAKSLELRATTSLARLWQSQGKCEEAQQVLGDIYGWFTEGFDTADLQEAKMLLEELRG